MTAVALGRGQRALQASVRDTRLCTGCGACVGLCPYQAWYRDDIVTLSSCDLDAGGCYAFCPRTPTDLAALRRMLFDARDVTPELGAVKGFYVARATDAALRSRCQHGGTVTTLVSLALREGLIDSAVLAEQRRDLLPAAVSVSTPSEAEARGKSRFVVSPTLAAFNRLACEGGKRIGVVATPCQALALAKMRQKPVAVAVATYADRIEQLRLVIGLFCGWALVWRGLARVVRDKAELSAITGMDIPPSKYHTLRLDTERGSIDVSLDEITSHVREACRYCPDLTAELSDISVGSARLPEGWEEAKHWNQVIVRTEVGAALMKRAVEQGLLELRDVPEGSRERLAAAAMGKKRAAVANLMTKSQDPGNLLYLDPRDPALAPLVAATRQDVATTTTPQE